MTTPSGERKTYGQLAAVQIGWQSKALMLKTIAGELSLGTDSFMGGGSPGSSGDQMPWGRPGFSPGRALGPVESHACFTIRSLRRVRIGTQPSGPGLEWTMRVADVMQTDLRTIRGTDNLTEAIALLAESHVSGVPVVDDHGRASYYPR